MPVHDMARAGIHDLNKGGPVQVGILALLALAIIVFVWVLLEVASRLIGLGPAIVLGLGLFALSMLGLARMRRR